jgi:ribosomal protein S20
LAQTQHVLIVMEENNVATKSMLEKIWKRINEQIIVGDQRHEAQATFNTQVSQELHSMCKQLDLTQADVDEARKATLSAPPPAV